MVISPTTWTLTPEDEQALRQGMERLLQECSAQCAMLVDRGGQLLVQAGERPAFDATTFATLTAADFSANDQLAKMIGEPEFASLVHQGEKESMFLADVAKRVILVVLFDKRATLGLVKLKAKAAVEQLNKVFEEMFNRVGTGPTQPGLLEGAEDEIDKLFG